MEKLNIAAILVAVVVNFVLSFIWFNILFGKVWGKEMGYDPNIKLDSKVMIKGLVFMVIGIFMFAWVFAHNILAWSFVPGMDQMSKPASALTAAVFTWVGFYVPGHLSATVWENRSWTLTAINAGYNLVSLLIVAFVLCLWA
jgi:hypothetical protein